MKNGGDNKLKSLLKKVEIQTPPPTFTEEVMKEIEAMAGEKVYTDPLLKEILQKNISHAPSNDFTYKVLNKTRGQSFASPPPIISNKVWVLIAVFFAFCVAAALVMEANGETGRALRYYLPVGEYLSDFTLRFIEPVGYLGIITASAGLLLALDHLARKLRSRHPG